MEQPVVQQELDRGADSIWGQCARSSHKAGRWEIRTSATAKRGRSLTSVVVGVAATTAIAPTSGWSLTLLQKAP